MIQFLAAVLLSYFLGAIPFSLWAGKVFAGVDLRKIGSGNLGATNVFRVLGARVAIPVLLLDAAKGFIAARFSPSLAGASSIATGDLSLICGISSILGHSFSVFVGFRGGKGVATSLGVFLAIVPKAVLVAFLIWIAVFLGAGYVSLASCIGALVLPVSVYFFSPGRLLLVLVTSAVAIFILLKHIPNMKRLVKGEEKKLLRRGHKKEGGAS
ncbi:MAG: glycerol-3-phosphate 1-O-acyltransferase PlsY [Candidatus Eisenbacteria bacterium]|nr:glycerol-3-phosphate 1-O-acyltransferase PlsY [Candidatus Eisenbacteria bacterium]